MCKKLKEFKEFKISRKELEESLGEELWNGNFQQPEIVYAADVVNAIRKHLKFEITQEVLLEWVNTLWFTDVYDYSDEEGDSIADVMNCLEELDEDAVGYSRHDFARMIEALEMNVEFKI